MRRIALLSDTHGHLDPKVHPYLETVDEVWHAGDIGENSVLEGLQERYSLRAVYGNIDSERIRREVPKDQRFEVEGVKVWMTHIGGRPGKYPDRVREGFALDPPDIFVCGHSHILKVEYDEREGILYMNPGAVGNEGFHRVKTLLRFDLEGGEPRNMEAIELGKRGSG
jgi:putative phosphoesterase